MIWIISDTHWFHKTIVKYENRPTNHNELMIKNWNRLVAPTDLVYHLGDLMMGTHPWLINQLNGTKVLVRGNHDRQSMEWYLSNGISFVCDSFTLKAFGKCMIFSHVPIPNLPKQYDLNIHGHFHSITHRDTSEIPNYETDSRYSLFTIELEDYSPIPLREFVERDFRRLPKERE